MKILSMEDYQHSYKESKENPEKFWSGVAENFSWQKKWNTVFSGGYENLDFKWFDGAELNITENCLDRHLEKNANKLAVVFEPNNPGDEVQTYTYRELHRAVCKTSNMLKELGVKKSDRVCLYMGMVPELLISVLACARIGAIHSVVFGGFSAQSLSDRINDSECKLLITNDGSYRGEKVIALKEIADKALETCPSIESVLIHKRVHNEIKIQKARDYIWQALYHKQSDDCPFEIMKAEDPLFILYTSGSTGKPKGLLHTVAGYMVWANYTFENVFSNWRKRYSLV